MNVEILGLDELLTGMAALSVAVQAAAPRIAQAAAEVVLQEARSRVRSKTGEVEHALELTRPVVDAGKAAVQVQVADSGAGGEAHHAVFLEYGTHIQAARPFMRPALAASTERVGKQMSDDFLKIIVK